MSRGHGREAGELAGLVRRKGFTPRAEDAAGLVALLTGEEDEGLRKDVARALALVPAAGAAAVVAALTAAVRPLRGHLVELGGKLAEGDPGAAAVMRPVLRELLRDRDLKAQINAVTALGKLPGEGSDQALLALLAEGPRREVRLALVRSLGKVGGAAAQEALRQLSGAADLAQDPALKQALERALLILGRETTREEESSVDGEAVLPEPVTVWLHARRGLEGLLVAEAKAAGFGHARRVAPGVVALQTKGPLTRLWALRLFERMGLPVTGDAALQLLSQPATRRLLSSLTRGLVRFRLDWPEAGDAARWDLVQRLAASAPDLVNDPTGSTWEIRVLPRSQGLELIPKRLPDPRFTYREGFVFAASHPTLAAALARVAAPRAGDLVWDPFTGSGTELVEVARLAPVAGLWGTDLDPRAITTATANLAAAGVTAPLQLAATDCLSFRAVRPTLIVSNPPMGRRVHRGTLEPLIEAVTAHAAELLAPGGRLVWLSPLPELTTRILESRGLRLTLRQEVDMGGFAAELQRAERLT